MSIVDAEIHDPDWVFESTVHHPDGFRVTATITVPLRDAWPDVSDVAELAPQSAASQAAKSTAQIRRTSEEPPF